MSFRFELLNTLFQLTPHLHVLYVVSLGKELKSHRGNSYSTFAKYVAPHMTRATHTHDLSVLSFRFVRSFLFSGGGNSVKTKKILRDIEANIFIII